MATVTPPPAGELPRQVGLAFQVFKITRIDDAHNFFECDFLLYQKWLAPELMGYPVETCLDQQDVWHPQLKFRNSIQHDMEYERTWVKEYDTNGDAVVWKYQRYKGKFYQTMQLSTFPFDCQDLCIVIDTSLELRYCQLVQRDDVHCSFSGQEFELIEWDFLPPCSQSDTIHSPTGLVFPKFTLNMPVKRKNEWFIWNVFLVVSIMEALSLVSFRIPHSNLSERLSVTLTMFLALTGFKFVIFDRMPKVAYLTTLDVHLLSAMIGMLAITVENTYVCTASLTEAQYIDKYCFLGIVVIWVLGYLHLGILHIRMNVTAEGFRTKFISGDLGGYSWNKSKEQKEEYTSDSLFSTVSNDTSTRKSNDDVTTPTCTPVTKKQVSSVQKRVTRSSSKMLYK